MSKLIIPFATPDISSLARSLRAQLAELGHAPSHVEMLNLLAKAGGHTNFQHMRADAAAAGRLSASPASPPLDHTKLEKLLRHFDAEGRMLRWPGKTSHQDLCLWVVWSRIPADTRMSEPEVNEILKDAHHFGDHAILRRSLVDMKMLARTPDGRLYRRIEKAPTPDAAALIGVLSQRRATA